MSWSDPPEVRFAEKLECNLDELGVYDIIGLDEVIFEIRNLKNEGFYYGLIDAVRLKNKIYVRGAKYSRDEGRSIRLLMLGNEILSDFTLYLPSVMDLIHFEHFYMTYVVLERVYYMYHGLKLERDDLNNVYFSGLDRKVFFALDKFDEDIEIPEISEDFFWKLKELKWENEESKKIYNKLKWSMSYVGETLFGSGFFGGTPGDFSVSEDFFVLFLAGCSAVSCGRALINGFDVVMAYKTYFKLLKTDVTVYKADIDLARESGFILPVKGKGYLVCEKCNTYYKLQKDESSSDFEDTCECGGYLVFREEL